MRHAGRLGDRSHVPSDTHGGSCCAHAAIGPSIQGSANVMINGRLALRVGDSGKHVACCGDGSWEALEGAPTVLINDRRAHRRRDADVHCGGLGATIDGSPDVLIGDHGNVGRLPLGDVAFLLVDGQDRPIGGAGVVVRGPGDAAFPAVTDKNGRVVLRSVRPGVYRLEMNGALLSSTRLTALK